MGGGSGMSYVRIGFGVTGVHGQKKGKFSGVWMRKENGHEHVRLHDKERIRG